VNEFKNWAIKMFLICPAQFSVSKTQGLHFFTYIYQCSVLRVIQIRLSPSSQ
jgi:hypothetical protein